METQSNRKITQLRLHGGGSKSNLWCQIFSDLLNRQVVRIQTSEATTLGGGILAAKAGELYPSVFEAAKNMVRIKDSFAVNENNSELYEKIYSGVYLPNLQKVEDLTKSMIPSVRAGSH